MEQPRPCGCKGCRTCLICEKNFDLKKESEEIDRTNAYVYCPYCKKAYLGWDIDDYKLHPNHVEESIDYPGVYINLDFLSEKEEMFLMEGIDSMPWDLSQSGRRKQNFGPKCNFKKRKLKLGDFNGFPKFSQFIQNKFENEAILTDFKTIEQCSLEYDPTRGASIDPHIDDCWIWGERIVTVNLLSDSVLTMTINKKVNRYNLSCVKEYDKILNDQGEYLRNNGRHMLKYLNNGPVVRIPMPRRSLLVIYGEPRYDWEHRVLREDIKERRVCLAYREFTPPYLPDGTKSVEGEKIILRAKNFWEHDSVNCK